eukprot:UN05777
MNAISEVANSKAYILNKRLWAKSLGSHSQVT